MISFIVYIAGLTFIGLIMGEQIKAYGWRATVIYFSIAMSLI